MCSETLQLSKNNNKSTDISRIGSNINDSGQYRQESNKP